MKTATKPVSPSPLNDRGIRLSLIACALGFGGFVLWAAFAKLDEGVIASGNVVVQDNRKAVQHFEGGIIRELYVREGQTVDAGEILMELEPVQSEAARDELAQEYAVQLATLLRLTALRDDLEVVDFTEVRAIEVPGAVAEDIIARQTILFEQQRQALAARLSVLSTQKEALEGRARDLNRQISATNRSLATAKDDLALRRELLSERLETIGNVQRLEREVSSLEADLSRLIGDRNQARKSTEEVEEQMAEARASTQEQTGQQIVETQGRSLMARERLLANQDRLSRTVIRAPEAGTVLNLAQTTVGGVVAPGEMIMEIVPASDDLIVSVRLSPTDRDAVAPGQDVEAQLSAYKSFIAPRLPGTVLSVSADLKQDEATGVFFYEARVSLDPSDLDTTRVKVLPGMPVETFIASGTSRTFLDYVFEPIRATFQRGTRMS